MAKPIAKRRHDEAERAFRKAWKLLDRIERRLERARAEERKRLVQLGDGSGPDAPRRTAQLEAARAEIAQIEGLLTELSELIAGNSRASSGQTVKDMAMSVAAEIKDEAAEPPQLRTRRNRHHRPRRKPTTTDADASAGSEPIPLPASLAAPADDRPATSDDGPAPRQTPISTSKPASVAYRSLVSQPPAARRPARLVADADPSGDAGPAGNEPTAVGDPSPDADRDDPPAEGA
jgi:hypothetical protein